MKVIKLPQLTGAQLDSWLGLAEFANKFNNDWILIGGQLVQLYCWERDIQPQRITTDIDAILNIVSRPTFLNVATKYLTDINFKPGKATMQGHQHRWVRGQAEIDLLIPDNIGATARKKTNIAGSTTLEAPGGKMVFDFAEKVKVQLQGQEFIINRPNMWGALFIKSKALLNPNEKDPQRHYEDLATLLTIFDRDLDGVTEIAKAKSAISSAIANLAQRPDVIDSVLGSSEPLQRMKVILAG